MWEQAITVNRFSNFLVLYQFILILLQFFHLALGKKKWFVFLRFHYKPVIQKSRESIKESQKLINRDKRLKNIAEEEKGGKIRSELTLD